MKNLGSRTVVAALVSAVLAVALGARPAFASLWQLTDSFDANPSATWSFFAAGSGGGVFETGFGTARTGSTNAFLRADTEFTSVGRTVHVTPKQVHSDANCSLSFQVSPVGPPSLSLVNVEVIDPGSWNYLAVQTVRISSAGYRQVVSPNWTGGPVDVVARLSVLAGRGFVPVRVDDMIMQCAFQ